MEEKRIEKNKIKMNFKLFWNERKFLRKHIFI